VGPKEEVNEAVAGYFRDPGAFSTQGKQGILKGAQSPVQSKSEKDAVVPLKQEQSGPSVAEKKTLTEADKKIMDEFKKEEVFKKLIENIKLQMTSENLI